MLSYTDLKKGVRIIFGGDPYEVLESQPQKKAQRRVVIQTRIKNLVSGSVLSQNFHQGDTFEEADILKIEVKFLYSNRGQYFFSEKENPGKRFSLEADQVGEQAQFLKQDQIVDAIIFDEKVINISLPIKIELKVTEAPPGEKGSRAQSGTKNVTLETGAKINTPLFIEVGDIIEINTETGDYVRRIG